MEKLTWVKPEMEEVRFAANEYIAACGESGSSYKFVCDAAAGILYWFYDKWLGGNDSPFHLRVDDENPGIVPNLSDYTPREIGSYSPCNATHEASTSSEFYWGFVDNNNNEQYDVNEEVIIWRNFELSLTPYNAHATKNLNMSKWETTRS